jgi:hypothetical protein
MILETVITWPGCRTSKLEIMPTEACRVFYQCTKCGTTLRPKPGDCCVFCSYGTVLCPPIQAERSGKGGVVSCCFRGPEFGPLVNSKFQHRMGVCTVELPSP